MPETLDIHVIALDETHMWDLEGLAAHVGVSNTDELRNYLVRIEGLYFFDRNEVTHCCEITPSYCLHPYDNRAICNDLAEETKNARGITIGDRIDDWVSQQMDYAPSYVHCHSIEALIERYQKEGVDFRYKHIGNLWKNPDYDWRVYTEEPEMMDLIRQDLQANAPM